MNNTIWKYSVPFAGEFTLDMPKGAEVLTLQLQEGEPVMWVAVDPDAEKEEIKFSLIGTGHAVDFELIQSNYIGTYQELGGKLVWHLFQHKYSVLRARVAIK